MGVHYTRLQAVERAKERGKKRGKKKKGKKVSNTPERRDARDSHGAIHKPTSRFFLRAGRVRGRALHTASSSREREGEEKKKEKKVCPTHPRGATLATIHTVPSANQQPRWLLRAQFPACAGPPFLRRNPQPSPLRETPAGNGCCLRTPRSTPQAKRHGLPSPRRPTRSAPAL